MRNESMNHALRSLYADLWPDFLRLKENHAGLSTPYFATVGPDYETAPKRVLLVGKETNDWANWKHVENESSLGAVNYLMRRYRKFAFGAKYPGRGSFWTPVKELGTLLNPGGAPDSFVALNVSKMDQERRRPGRAVRDEMVRTDILASEISILKPHVVVFLCGHAYDSWLKRWFPDLTIDGDRWLATLGSERLPKHSFRSYHPQYLNYKSKRKEIFGRIAALTRG